MLMIKKIGFLTVLRVLADDCPLATISRDAVEPFARVRQVRPLPLKRRGYKKEQRSRFSKTALESVTDCHELTLKG